MRVLPVANFGPAAFGSDANRITLIDAHGARELPPGDKLTLARQLVAERVSQVAPQLPPGTDAPLLSSLTGRLNEILEFTLEAEPGVVDLMTLRDLAEFEVSTIKEVAGTCPANPDPKP